MIKYFIAYLFFAVAYACPFCDPAIINTQKFYEDTLVIALYNYQPRAPGHCLIIPKRHVERFDNLTNEEALQIFTTIQIVNEAVKKVFETDPYLLLQKNGTQVGQSVPHVHVHYIPRKLDQTSKSSLLFDLLTAHFYSPIPASVMQEIVQKLSAQINADLDQ